MRSRSQHREAGVSRRELLQLVVVANGALLVGGRELWAAAADPEVAEIVAKTITVDMHNHWRVPGGAPDQGTELVAAMRQAGLSVVCLTYALDGPLMRGGDTVPGTRSNLRRDPEPGELYQAHLKVADGYDEMLESTEQLQRVLTYSDIEAAHKEGRPVIIQDAEGADFLEKGHLDRLEEAHKRGLRKLQLVHYAVNDIADFQIGPEEHRGLSPFGVAVVKECDRLGIVVDVCHTKFDGVKGVVEATSKPILLSHTSLRGSKAQGTYWADNFRGGLPTMQARQITPEHAKAVADTGGVVGLWALFPTAETYVQGIREMVDVVGVDHVGIGRDGPVIRTQNRWPDQTEGLMYTVIGLMLKQGFTPEECGKIAGGNVCRVFEACL